MADKKLDKRIPGGQPGNRNSLKHGLRMALNELPKGCGRLRRERYIMRSLLESAVVERDGTIGTYQAAVIQTACRWATHSALAARWLRLAPDLTIEQKLALSKAVALGSENRDRCLKALGLHRVVESDPWAVLDASRARDGLDGGLSPVSDPTQHGGTQGPQEVDPC